MVSDTKEVTVNANVGETLTNIYDKTISLNSDDKLNENFMTVVNGLKENKLEYSENVYQSAINNAIKLSSDEYRLPLLMKNMKTLKNPLEKTTLKVTSVARSCCGDCTIITQEDFSPGVPYVIFNSGKYCLGEDITYTPTSTEFLDSAIIITTNNVILDMCGHKNTTR